jgi:diacylglycerol kinase family enzyme
VQNVSRVPRLSEPGQIATLIVNPSAGRASLLRAQLPAIQDLLAAKGFRTQLCYTEASEGSTERLARAATKQSSLVLACGGDGTVHGVLQALANSETVLGVVPLGTANALARNLLLSLDPLDAIKRLLTYEPTRIPVGEIETSTCRRFFLVMAGCGPDGALVHALSGAAAQRFKSRFGRASYDAKAAHLFLTRSWPAFRLEYRCASSPWQEAVAVAVMASRLPDLGGLFSGLTPRAALLHPHLHLQVISPPAQLSFPAWFALSRFGLPNPLHRTLNVEEFRCIPRGAGAVYAQADAEPLGPLPFTARIVPDALTLLMPPG